MELYPTAAAISNTLAQLPAPVETWSLAARMRRVLWWMAQPGPHRWANRRRRLEGKLDRWHRAAPRLIGQLRAIAENHRERAELVAVADVLELVTPERLGALRDTRPRKKAHPRRTSYYVPAAAEPHVRAWVKLARWASRVIATALGGLGRALRSLLQLARPVAPRHARLPQEAPPPHPATGEETTSGVVISTSEEEWHASAGRIAARNGWAVAPEAM